MSQKSGKRERKIGRNGVASTRHRSLEIYEFRIAPISVGNSCRARLSSGECVKSDSEVLGNRVKQKMLPTNDKFRLPVDNKDPVSPLSETSWIIEPESEPVHGHASS